MKLLKGRYLGVALLGAIGHIAQAATISDWKMAHFSREELADGRSADAFSALGDGWSNLEKYAFGLSPQTKASDREPVLFQDAGHLHLQFYRVKAAIDIVVTVETSSDLFQWDTAPTAAVEVSVTSVQENLDRVIVRDAVPLSGQTARYLRIRVTRTISDSDQDGVEDDVELAQYGTLGDPAFDPTADPDNDGLTNLAGC
jgi:hypothetical protein